MSLVISRSVAATPAAVSLSRSYRQLSTSSRRLAAGLSVEDSAVSALSRSECVVLQPEEYSASEALELLRVAGEALKSTEAALDSMAALAREAADARCSAVRRREHETRYRSTASAINQIVQNAQHEGAQLLDGSLDGVRLQPDSQLAEGCDLHIPALSASALGLGPQAKGAGRSVSTREAAQAALQVVVSALENVRSVRSGLTEAHAGMEEDIQSVRMRAQNMSASQSRVSDADVALDMLEFVHAHVLRQPNVGLLSQANTPRLALGLL